MKISEAQTIYRAYRQELIDQTKDLIKQRDVAQKQYQATGEDAFGEQAATLQLSIDATKKKFDDNQKVLDSLTEQYATVWNAEVAKQQSDPETGMAAEMTKLMTVARRIANGDIVPYSDEKKLMEYSADLYQAVKSAQMLHMMEEHKKYDSLWDDEEDPSKKYDPEGKAENAHAQGDLPDIPEAAPAVETETT